jgi:hypothetical protein
MLPSHELLGEETPLLPQHSTLQKLANGILGVIFFFLFFISTSDSFHSQLQQVLGWHLDWRRQRINESR